MFQIAVYNFMRIYSFTSCYRNPERDILTGEEITVLEGFQVYDVCCMAIKKNVENSILYIQKRRYSGV